MVNVIRIRVFIALMICVGCVLSNLTTYAKSAGEQPTLSTNTTCFIENKGQIIDQYQQPRHDIDFKLPAANGLTVFIGAGHMHYMWGKLLNRQNANEETTQPTQDLIATYRMDVILEGSNTNVLPEKHNKTGYYERYYKAGLDGVVAEAYNKIVYKNIYNNIDWILYTHNGTVKYDFIVHPGGNVNDIKLRYNGAEQLSIEEGKLIATTPYGTITENAPYTYHAYIDDPVTSAYKLQGNVMSFEVGEYHGKIVIDPSLEWASYMGGSSIDYSYGIVSDTGRNVYIVGNTNSSSTNVASKHSFQDTITGDYDGYIVKYAPGGARQWGTYYGGYGSEVINSMAIDGDGDLVFCGVTDTSTTMYVKNAHQSGHGGGVGEVFLAKINVSGSILWATYYGGSGTERNGTSFQTDVKCDINNNVYLVGTTTSDTGIATTGTAQASRVGLYDGFIAKFNTSGVRQWGSYYGGTYDDAFTNVALDSNGMVYVAGQFRSSGLGTSGTHAQNRLGNNSTINGNRDYDAAVVKFNPATGARIWCTYYGASLEDNSRGIAVGDTGYVYMSGSTLNSSGIATNNTAQTSIGGFYDAFLVKLDSNGGREWGTYCGGNGTDHGGNVVIDHEDNPNMSGRTASPNNISTNDGHQTVLGGGSSSSAFDAMMIVFDKADGKKKWGSYYGGSANDYGYSIATAGLGHMYICGNTESSTDISYSGHQNSYAGNNDAFLAKFTPDTSAFVFQPFTQTVHCQEDSFVLKYGTTAPFRTNNSFTVQLSDNTGSFTSPINIGYKQTTTDGTIKCGIPNTVSGNGFRIRIISTIPIDTSDDNGVDIDIKPLPTKPVASSNTPVCSNDTLLLKTLSSGTGVTYIWTGPSSYNTSSQDTFATRINMNSGMSGDYFVTADLDGCTRADTTAVTILQAAAKPAIQSNAPLCNGDSLELVGTNYTTGAAIKWDGPNSWLDTNTLQSGKSNMQAADAGDYVLTLWQNGCASKDTVAVTVGQRPLPVTASSNNPVCTNDSIQLYATSATSGVVYNWYGPAGYTAFNKQSAVRSSIVTAHTGEYVAEADLNGCKVRDTIYVAVLQAPDKPNAGSNIAICSGDDVMRTGTNIAPGTATASWLRIGASTPLANPLSITNIQTNQSGDYVLTSEMPNGCKMSDTIEIAVTLSTPLSFNVNIAPGTMVCPATDLTFSVSPPQSSGSSYTWSGPGGFSGNTSTVTKNNAQYADSGYYKVRIVSSACAVGIDSVKLRVVNSLAPPKLTLPASVCEGDTVVINIAHPSSSQQFTLYYPNNDSLYPVGPKVTIHSAKKLDHEGRYIAKAQTGGCISYDTAYINTIKPKPEKPNLNANTPLCAGENLNLTANSITTGVSYSWQGPTNYSSNTQNPNIPNVKVSQHTGDYIAIAQLNGCYSEPDTINVVVEAIPQPSINTKPNVCEGEDILLALDSNNANEIYQWSSLANTTFAGTGASATLANAKLSDQGTFVVVATSATNGCEGRDTAYVGIVPLPGALEAYYNSPLCEGDTLFLNANDTSRNVSYVWAGANGFVSSQKAAQKNVVTVADNGIYTIRATRQSKGIQCSNTGTIDVIVKPTPQEPLISSNTPVPVGGDLELLLQNPQAGVSYQWNGPSGYGSRLENPILNSVGLYAGGAYTLTADLNGCLSSAITTVVIDKLAPEKVELILYPNPNDGTFTVIAKVAEDQLIPYEVVSVSGSIVHRGEVQTRDKKMEVNINIKDLLPSGVFVFRAIITGQSREVPFSLVR